jgi:mono/diheme cytochrome c family protein
MYSIARRLLAILLIILLAACWNLRPENIGVSDQLDFVERGSELVNGLAACGSCHGITANPGSPLAGGRAQRDRYGLAIATNLTPDRAGVVKYSTRDLLELFRSSKKANGEIVSAEFHAGYRWMSDPDIYAIAAYLVTLEPVVNEVEPREISWFDRNIFGFWESRPELRGYVPAVRSGNYKAHGRYLVDNVARCGACHSGLPGWFSDAPYLRGRVLELADGEVEAPAIISRGKNRANHWSEEQLVNYLRTGETASGKKVSSEYCPTNFFAQAKEDDLHSIAAYLTSLK